MTDREKETLCEQPNIAPTIHLSKSLLEIIKNPPAGAAAISSIAALFIVIILSILIPTLFVPNRSS